MPTKTITLEIDAYEKLRAAKCGGESFTEVDGKPKMHLTHGLIVCRLLARGIIFRIANIAG